MADKSINAPAHDGDTAPPCIVIITIRDWQWLSRLSGMGLSQAYLEMLQRTESGVLCMQSSWVLPPNSSSPTPNMSGCSYPSSLTLDVWIKHHVEQPPVQDSARGLRSTQKEVKYNLDHIIFIINWFGIIFALQGNNKEKSA